MELIFADSSLKDIKRIFFADADFEIGTKNDFEIKINRDEWDSRYFEYGNVFYIPNSEFGGIIGEIQTDTSLNTTSLLGRTWRGMLDKKIICPIEGQDYYYASGELNSVLKRLISSNFDKVFAVPDIDTKVTVSDYKFDRYCTLLSGINKMLQSVGYKLQIKYIQQERGQAGYVELTCVPIKDYSEKIELSQDSQLDFRFNQSKNRTNHLICLGKGELKDREVIHLYVQKDGTIGNEQYQSGINEIVEVYDNSSASSEELIEGGIKKLQELMNVTTFDMDVGRLNINIEIGDIIGGRDYLTGLYIKKPIVKKIYRFSNEEESLEYSLEGDD